MTTEHGPTPPTLTQATLSGVRWTYTSLGASAFVQLVFTVIVSRLIDPDDFGLFAVSMTLVAMAQLFGQVGLGQAVIQRRDLSDEMFRSAFWFGVLLAVGLSAIVVIVSEPLARLMGTPEVAGVLAVLALTFLINGVAAAPVGFLRRNFEFRRMAVAEVSSTTIAYLMVGVAAAAIGLGVWALVLSAVVYPVIRLVIVLASPTMPSLAFRLRVSEVRPLLRFGGTLAVVGLIQQASSSATVIGMTRIHGAGPAGQQNRANALVQPLLVRAVTGLSSVLFPAMSSINREPARLYSAKHEALLIAGAAFVPVCAIGAAIAPEGIAVLLGPGWDLAAEMLPWILLYLAASLIGHFYGVAVDAFGAVGGKLLLEVVYLGAVVGAIATIGTRSPTELVMAVAVLRLVWAVAYAVFAAAVLRILLARPLGLIVRLASGGVIVFVMTSAARSGIAAALGELAWQPFVLVVGVFAGLVVSVLLWWRGAYRPARLSLANRLAQSPSTMRFSEFLGHGSS